jgi:anaerobic magnesium-protoporphyrin IX monomethyl ester cyclase
MMKVALIVPTYEYANPGYIYLAPSDFPTGLAYLAGALKRAGHEVIGVNVNNQPPEKPKRQALHDCLVAMLEDNRPDLIGIGGLCADYAFIKDALAILRSLAPDIPVVMGGGIVTHDAEFVFGTLKPDYCVVGDGEEVLIQLVDHLATGTPAITAIPNLGYWQDGQTKFTKENLSYPSLDQRAWPDYEPFDIDTMLACSTHGARNHYRYSREHPRIMPFIAARNCPFKCTFCVHQGGAKYNSRPMADIFAELEDLHAKYNFNILIILDELFSINKDRLREFCEGILERKETLGWDFDWMFQTHASAALSVDDMRLARKAGCYYFSYGMESASPRVLESMRKKTHPDQIREAIAFAREAKIGFGGNFIFGDLAENQETIIETMTFLTRYCMDMLCYVTNISPYPGSLLFDHCMQQGLIRNKLDYYETIDQVCHNMTTMPDDAWRQFLSRLIWPMAGAYPWLISVEPDEITTEAPDPAFPTLVRRAVARCPHCGTAHTHRQPISDAVFAHGTIFPTGCPACGQRFRLRIGANGQCSGAVLGREIDAETLTRLTKEALVPLAGVRRHVNILFLPADSPASTDDPIAPVIDYLTGIALEEGFAANRLSVMTVPACKGQNPDDRSTWLAHLRKVCAGIRFDQIWVQLVDAELDDPLLSFLGALAPVRVGLIPRPMSFGEPIFRIPADLKSLQRHVDRRLRSMTHLLAADPHDVRWLAENRRPQVRWWLPALPERALPPPMTAATHARLVFGLPADAGIVAQPGTAVYRPTGDAERIPSILAQTAEQIAGILRSGNEYPANLPTLHADALRQLQGLAFDLLRGEIAASTGCTIVDKSPFTIAALALLAIASGRPAIVVRPSRPELEALLATGPGVYMTDDAATELVPPLPPAANAALAFLAAYRVDERLRDWLDWIAASGGEPPTTMATPTVGPLNQIADFAVAAQAALQREDFDGAILILEQARQADPLNADLAMLHGEIRTLREEKIRSRIESVWQREMSI